MRVKGCRGGNLVVVVTMLEGGSDLDNQTGLPIMLAYQCICNLVAAAGLRIVDELAISLECVQAMAQFAFKRMFARTITIGLFPERIEPSRGCFPVLHTLLPTSCEGVFVQAVFP